MANLVLDTYPLIAFFEEQKEATTVERILRESKQAGRKMYLSTINAGEIWYTVTRSHSKNDADQVMRDIYQLEIRILPVDWQLTQIAAQFKVPGGISYADCFAAALAKSQNAPLVTGDREFERLADDIEIMWV